MFGLPNLYLIGGLVLGLAASHALVWNHGRTWEQRRTIAANAVATVEALKSAGKEQKRVGDLDAAGLCKELGGTWRGAECE